MVDREQRAKLEGALDKLVAGELTNDQFDDLYYDQWEQSPDRGVQAIAGFGYSLYSSDLPIAYRLTGRYAPDDETQQVTERCLRFLATDQEYGWPERPNQTLDRVFGGLSVFLVMPLGGALFFGGFFSRVYFIVGPAVMLLGYILFRASRSLDTPQWRAYWAAGDKEAWPFLRATDCAKATK